MASEKLKIYSDRSLMPHHKPHAVMLYPFWGKNPEEPLNPLSGQFDHYLNTGHAFFEMTSLAEADLVIAPLNWEDSESGQVAIHRLAEQTKAVGKPIVVFFWSDSSAPVQIENAKVFRTSLYRSRQKKNEFAMPAWSEDFTENYTNGQIMVRQKRSKPIIGFCGYISRRRSWAGMLKDLFRTWTNRTRILDSYRAHSAHYFRAQALNILSRSPAVETNFLARDRFFAGTLVADPANRLSRMRESRQEYIHNMVESDYVLCIRGAGNYSYRLYETLSMGRIPVFVDTDCVLPYDFECNWTDHCVWVNQRELNRIPETVSEFHEKLSPSEFIALQHDCRRFWESWLAPSGFFSNFYRHFKGESS